jgi:hypothetical protein
MQLILDWRCLWVCHCNSAVCHHHASSDKITFIMTKNYDYCTSFLQPWEQMVSHSVYSDDTVMDETSVHISKTTSEVAHLSFSSVCSCSGFKRFEHTYWCIPDSITFSDIQILWMKDIYIYRSFMSLGLKSKYLSICAKVKHKLISNKLNSIVCSIERTSLADLLICTFLRSKQKNWNGSFSISEIA